MKMRFGIVILFACLGCANWQSLYDKLDSGMGDAGLQVDASIALDGGTTDAGSFDSGTSDGGFVLRSTCVNTSSQQVINSEPTYTPISIARKGDNQVWVQLSAGITKPEWLKYFYVGEGISMIDESGLPSLLGISQPGRADPESTGMGTFVFPFENVDGGKQVVIVEEDAGIRIVALEGIENPQIASVFQSNFGVSWSVWGNSMLRLVQNVGLPDGGRNKIQDSMCGLAVTFDDVEVLPLDAGARAILSFSRDTATQNCGVANIDAGPINMPETFLYSVDSTGTIGQAFSFGFKPQGLALGVLPKKRDAYVAYSNGNNGFVRGIDIRANPPTLSNSPEHAFYLVTDRLMRFSEVAGSFSDALYVSLVTSASTLDVYRQNDSPGSRPVRFTLPNQKHSYIVRLKPTIDVIDLGPAPTVDGRLPIVGVTNNSNQEGIAVVWKSSGQTLLNFIPDLPIDGGCVVAP
jgi:hypothetical protein